MYLTLDWVAVYSAYKASGLTLKAFCREKLAVFCTSWRPCYETVRTHFKKLEQQQQAMAKKSSSSAITVPSVKAESKNRSSANICVATFSREEILRAEAKASRMRLTPQAQSSEEGPQGACPPLDGPHRHDHE